jgi:UDP-glucose 4-epimerase
MISLHNTKVLVTGGAGFIGSHLVAALLAEGAQVVVVDNLSTGHKENVPPGATLYIADINDQALETIMKVEKPEIVFMLAFNTIVPRSVRDPLFDLQSLTGTVHTVVTAKACGVKKIILASSGFVYGNTTVFPTPERQSITPDNPYIITKWSSENYLEFFRRTAGLDYVVLRYATVYGPRQTGGAMADYIRCITDGRQAEIYGDGSKTRDYVYVEDVVRANMAALNFTTPHSNFLPVFNIGTACERSLLDVYSGIAKILNKPEAKPDFKPDRPGELYRFCLDIAEARQHLGWEPTVTFDEGLRHTVEYFLSHRSL